MSNTNLKKLSEGGQESIRALIQAIAPDIANDSNGNLSSEEVANRLTDKLAELVGPEGAERFNQRHNERGELVNEEGLPIVEITEPVNATRTRSTASMPTPITVEPLIPLATLPPTAQEMLRQKRNRVLDLLEEEERQLELAEKKREAEALEELLRKRKEEAARDKDRLKETRDLQKKMGRALLQNIGKAKEKERQEQEDQRLLDEEADKRRSPSIKKKTVAFAESTEHIEKEPDVESSTSADWGDISPGRLRSTKRPTLMSQALLDRHPMKLSVVERVPGGQTTITSSSQPTRDGVDSDDDSEPDSLPHSSDTEAEEEPTLETDEVDIDFAQHQREIALEYYDKRNTIGQDAATAMMNHSHDDDAHAGSSSDVVQETPKPSISQFKANRLASAYNASTSSSEAKSTSLGASILPAASTRTIQRAVRTGKLDSEGKLIGGEADSASEDEDAGLQEVLKLLRKGEVYNLGPNGEYLHSIPRRGQEGSPVASSSSQLVQEQSQSTSYLPPPSMRTKTSRFKASRAAAGRPSSSNILIPQSSIVAERSPSITPVSHADRSSPKLPLPTPTAMTPTVGERNPLAAASTSSPLIYAPSPEKSSAQGPSTFSMIVDSPSFPMARESHSQSPFSMPSMIVESPSFPPEQSSKRLEGPPAVISSAVRETNSSAPRQSPSTFNEENKTKRISRFKAERNA